MTETKTYSKKLTESGGAVCVLTFIAFLLSACGVLTEYIGVNLYNRYYTTSTDYIFAGDINTFVSVYEKPVILTLVTFTFFIVLLVSKSKKRIGGEIPSILIVSAVALAIRPAFAIADLISTGEFSATMRYASDGDKFRTVLNLSISALPIISCFLLLIAGLVLCSKLLGEDFSVQVPITKKVSVSPTPAPVIKQAQPTVEPKFEYGHSNYIEPDVADSYKKDNGATPVNAVVKETEVETEVDCETPNNDTASEKIQADEDFIVCSVCNTKSPTSSKFCQKCGAEIKR